MSNPVYQDQRELQQLQRGLQYESTSGYGGRESTQSRIFEAELRGYRLNLDTEREAKVSSNTYGLLTTRGNALVHRGNVIDSSRPNPNRRVHHYNEVDLDSQHDFGTNLGDVSPAELREFLEGGKQRKLAGSPIVPGDVRTGPGHSRGRGPENQQYEASSSLQVEHERPSMEPAERGRRAGRHHSSKVSLPDPEALVRAPSSFPGSASPTPRSRNAYSISRATTNTAASSKSLSTAGTFAFNTTMTVMAIVALVFAILGYKVGVASAQSGDQALRLSMWEDCIEHSDILGNSATCKKLLDQGFDAIVSRSERFRGRRELEDVSNRCPCCLSELGVGRISSTVAA